MDRPVFVLVAHLTPAELATSGIKLYGRKKWKSHLARDLGVNVSTIHRIGHRAQVPGPYEVAVAGLLVNKVARDRLEKEARKLLPRRLRRRLNKKAKRNPPTPKRASAGHGKKK